MSRRRRRDGSLDDTVQRTRWARPAAAAGALVVLLAGVTGCAGGAKAASTADGVAGGATVGTPPGVGATGAASAAAASLSQLRVIPDLPDVPGYDRSCQTSHACVFGPTWSDDTSAPGAHNGCDSRSDAIAAAAREVTRSGRCKVASGVLDDPYTGRAVPFTAATISRLSIDHLVSLHRAWQLGASTWTPERRAAFANDVDLELIVTTTAVNAAKGDKGIGQWQPPNRAYRCTYAKKYIAVSAGYGLPITQQDRDTLTAVLSGC